VVAPRSSLTLFGWGASTQLARPGAGQTHHIAFRAPSDDAQQSWREHLLSMGLDVSPVMERSYFRSIYFSAPDGMILEIATDGPGFSLDEPIESLGADLRLPSWLEERKAQIAGKLTPLI
jgi:glyoxalase family protein